jgi:Rhodopirellula transposase DDE domain
MRLGIDRKRLRRLRVWRPNAARVASQPWNARRGSRTTIRVGRDELRNGVEPDDVVNVRRPGGGRVPLEEQHPELLTTLETLVDAVTRGDPESPLRWTSKSTHKLAEELATRGYQLARRRSGSCSMPAATASRRITRRPRPARPARWTCAIRQVRCRVSLY